MQRLKLGLSSYVCRWVKWFPADFRNEAALSELRALLHDLPQVGPRLLPTLASHLAVLERHRGFLEEERELKEGEEAPQLTTLCPLETAR